MTTLEKELDAVEKAATHAVNLVHKFADQDPSDVDSCWQNPTQMYQQLNEARARALDAWNNLQDAKTKSDSSIQAAAFSEQDLRTHFMDMVTDAFADVLAEMKDNVDLDILVDCLQSGIEILSQEDREFLMDDDAEEDVPPHEARRREMGYVETRA